MRELHHVGIPTKARHKGEIHMADAKLYVTDVAANKDKIEWLRFEDGSPLPEALKTTPHVAFMVDDLAAAMAGKQVLMEPFSPAPGLKVAFIIAEGVPIEFMQKTA